MDNVEQLRLRSGERTHEALECLILRAAILAGSRSASKQAATTLFHLNECDQATVDNYQLRGAHALHAMR